MPTSNHRTPAKRYRVEHHDRGAIRSFGYLFDAVLHHATLEPFVSELVRSGEEGQVVLIDETTGAVVARRQVRPFGSKPRDRFRRIHT